MPELGALNAKEAASLTGLAPATRQSGKWQGDERIQAGPSALRHSIFMPALTAIRYNEEFRAKCSALITAGKAPKVAVTAVIGRSPGSRMLSSEMVGNGLQIPIDSWVTWPARVAALMASDLSAALSAEAQVTVGTGAMQQILEHHVRAHLAELAEPAIGL